MVPDMRKEATSRPTVHRIRMASMVAFSRSTMPASMSEKLWPQTQPTMQATTMDTASGMWAST